VVADTSPVMNRPEGCGWIMSVRGIGAATLSDVQYDTAYKKRRMHKNMPVEHIKIIVFGVELDFRNSWDLGGGNYLLIHYDEKWFWGMVTKSTARTFDGLDQQTQQAYHKSHINKTMAVAFTAYEFKDNMENGGDGIKLGLFRVQSYTIAKGMVRRRVRQRDGSFMAGQVSMESYNIIKNCFWFY